MIETLLENLKDSNIVHVNMLRGIIARITMRQCAHVHGAAMVEWFNRAVDREPLPEPHSERTAP